VKTASVPLDAAVAARARVEAEHALLVQALKEQQLKAFYEAMQQRYARRTNVDWDGIAQCETGGNWSMRGSRFSGGLGFYNGTWNSFGGREFASNAGLATREQQIVVAERVTGTEWRPPGRLALHPGAEYFVHVDAFLSEARSVSSDHVPFSVAN